MVYPLWSLFVTVALATGPATQVQRGTLSGAVRDSHGAAVPGARIDVVCRGDRLTTVSSPTGEFHLTGLAVARCALEARADSFEPEHLTVDSGAGQPVTVVLQVRRFASAVVVTPGRGRREPASRVPEALSVVTRRDLDTRPYALLPQVLREEPGVLLQQTTSGQTSPVIRGFTGQSNLYLIDGVRLNTGQWRAGPSQYTAWVDAGPVDAIEVVRGAGSVQYGSDALGGTIHFLTSPTLLSPRASRTSANFEVSAASATRSVGGQAEAAVQVRRASLRIGATAQRVGDLRGGRGLDSHSAVTRYLGLPSTVVGTRMPGTDFDQRGAYGLALLALGPHGSLRALAMRESQTDASRYDRILGGQGLYRSGFDPQSLTFGVARYTRADAGPFDGISASLSLNRQADGRFEQARPHLRLDRQEATTTAVGYQVQGHGDVGRRQQWLVGGEMYDETIDAWRQLVEPAGSQPARPDIADGTTYRSYGMFAQHRLDLFADRLSVRGGGRFSGFRFATRPDAALGVTAEAMTVHTMTFQTALALAVAPGVTLTAGVNRAFRAPNAADLGGIGLTGGGGFEIAPSTAAALGAHVATSAALGAVSTGERVGSLRPEVVYQYDAGVKATAGALTATVNAFNLEVYDLLQRRALVFEPSIAGTTIAGYTVVRTDAAGLAYIAQDIRPVATTVNADRARVRGVDVQGELRATSALAFSAYFSVAHGRLLPQGEYMRRMPPPLGGARMRWSQSRWWVEGVISFAAEQDRLSSADLTDARIGALRTRASIAGFFNGTATDMGLVRDGILRATGETLPQVQARVLGAADAAPLFTSQPGFVVFGLRGGVRLTSSLSVSVFGENLTDVNYRLYGSGLDAPGVNVQVRTRYRF